MPFPLVLIEHHLIPIPAQFIFKNLASLKELGYKKILLEINQELTPEIIKAQIKAIPAESDLSKTFENLYKLICLLEQEQFDFEFIDPEPQEQALLYNQELTKAYLSGNQENIHEITKKRQLATDARDRIMAKKIISNAQTHQGGIIFITGFMHKHIIKILEETKEHFFRYLITSSKRIESEFYTINQENSHWLSLNDPKFRKDFYKTDVVQYLNFDEQPSFELIESLCQLTKNDTHETSSALTNYFSTAIQHPFSFFMDEHFVLNAKTQLPHLELEQLKSRIKLQFPKLRFFTEKHGENNSLTIPGLNLPEHQEMLSKEFKRLLIMK